MFGDAWWNLSARMDFGILHFATVLSYYFYHWPFLFFFAEGGGKFVLLFLSLTIFILFSVVPTLRLRMLTVFASKQILLDNVASNNGFQFTIEPLARSELERVVAAFYRNCLIEPAPACASASSNRGNRTQCRDRADHRFQKLWRN